MMQVLEPLLVHALVPELAGEAFDVAVLHRLPGPDEDVAYAMRLSPAPKRATGEFRADVGAHRHRVAPKQRFAATHADDVLAGDAQSTAMSTHS